MTQTLTSTINAVKAKMKNEEKQPEGAEAKATFHQRERERQALDPENLSLKAAIAVGQARTETFLKSVRDADHPEHEKAFAQFKNGYALDSKIAEADIVEKTCVEKKVSAYELRDIGYEQHIQQLYRPTGNVGHEQLAFYQNFVKALQKKWDEKGYRNDKPFVEDYTKKYGLTPNPNLSGIEPKM